MSRKKICILNMGGSLGMRYNKKQSSLEDGEIVSNLYQYIPELQSRFSIDIFHIYTGNSYNITHTEWLELAEVIKKEYDHYEGFVILHGTSTMAYTASYLSYVFQNLDKPIVFTGSILPLEEIGSEARNNIINACLIATMDVAEVVIVYGSLILRANRTTKTIENYANVFESPNFPELGEIKRPIILSELRKKRRGRVLKYTPTCLPNTLCIRVTPGLQAETILNLTQSTYHALVLEAYGAGCFPTELVSAIKVLLEKDFPVVLASQMPHGIATPFTYNTATNLHETNLMFSYDMTTEAVVTKLMWAMGQTKEPYQLQTIMHSDIAGELSPTMLTTPPFKKY